MEASGRSDHTLILFIKRFRLLLRTFIPAKEELRRVVISVFLLHGTEAFQNYRQGLVTSPTTSARAILNMLYQDFEEFNTMETLSYRSRLLVSRSLTTNSANNIFSASRYSGDTLKLRSLSSIVKGPPRSATHVLYMRRGTPARPHAGQISSRT